MSLIFRYYAKDESGQDRNGEINALNKKEVVKMLQSQGLFIISLENIGQSKKKIDMFLGGEVTTHIKESRAQKVYKSRWWLIGSALFIIFVTVIIKKHAVEPSSKYARVDAYVARKTNEMKSEPSKKNIDEKAVYYIEKTKYSCRNVEATYLEMSVMYAVINFTDSKLLGWETEIDPQNPVATLVTMNFSVSGVQQAILNVLNDESDIVKKNRLSVAVPNLRITWRVNDLMSLKLSPYNWYAQDVLKVYQRTCDGLHELSE